MVLQSLAERQVPHAYLHPLQHARSQHQKQSKSVVVSQPEVRNTVREVGSLLITIYAELQVQQLHEIPSEVQAIFTVTVS
jgi:hypothetical protein